MYVWNYFLLAAHTLVHTLVELDVIEIIMVEVGIWSKPIFKQGHLEQAAQDNVQAAIKCLHSLGGQPAPVLSHLQSEMFSHVQREPPVFQFLSRHGAPQKRSCLSSPSLFTLPLGIYIHIYIQDCPLSFLFSRLNRPNSPSLSKDCCFCPLIILMALHWTLSYMCMILCLGALNWTQPSKCGLTSAEKRRKHLPWLCLIQLGLPLVFFATSAHCWLMSSLVSKENCYPLFSITNIYLLFFLSACM